MKPNGVLNVVLPAAEIVSDHQPTDTLLAGLGTSTKEVIQMFLDTWAGHKHFGDLPWSPLSGSDDLPYMFRASARLLVMDIIFEAMERRVEQGLGMKIGDDDRRAAEIVMMSIWDSLTQTIFPMTEELGMSDLQVSQLRFVQWLGDDFIISIPYMRTAKQEEERLREKENIRHVTSPLLNRSHDRWNDVARH